MNGLRVGKDKTVADDAMNWKEDHPRKIKRMKGNKEFVVKVLEAGLMTHDVMRIVVQKPDSYSFIPGQATEMAISKTGWKYVSRPFSFTSLQSDEFLEFMIKIYREHLGVTKQLLKLQPGDHVILHNAFGSIQYKGEGLFIAGGVGVTPFVAIIRDLHMKGMVGRNKLIFANKQYSDVFLEDEFRSMMGLSFINILSEERKDGFDYGLIGEKFLEDHLTRLDQFYYLCGPPPMMDMVQKQLLNLGITRNVLVMEG